MLSDILYSFLKIHLGTLQIDFSTFYWRFQNCGLENPVLKVPRLLLCLFKILKQSLHPTWSSDSQLWDQGTHILLPEPARCPLKLLSKRCSQGWSSSVQFRLVLSVCLLVLVISVPNMWLKVTALRLRVSWSQLSQPGAPQMSFLCSELTNNKN